MESLKKTIARAVAHFDAEDLPAAESVCREILASDPGNINARRIFGAIARKRGELERSLEYFQEAVRLCDNSGLLHFELGTAYLELKRPQEAYDCFLVAIKLDPQLQPAYVNLGAIMEQQDRFEEAIPWARKALALKPDCSLSLYNLANAQRELGRLDEAIENYRLSLQAKPDHAKTHWNMGICHLLAGNFEQGWPLFERRQDAQEVMFDRFPQPRWDGSPLDGRTIIVHAEQGIGDEVLFASCFPDIIRHGGGRVILVCDPRLETLWRRSFPEAKVYGHLRRKDWMAPTLPEPADVQLSAGSLPFYFRPNRASFPRRKRFLAADPKLEAMWRDRLAELGPELKIGISWRAGGKSTERRKRSLPLERWAEMFAAPGVRFVNLQYGDALADLDFARTRFDVDIHDWEEGDPLVDVDSYVAKIAALDLVISVGNATVHMAGAIGTPAWTLLPMVPSWRWMIAGEQSPWYSSVRLFRQAKQGEWQPVLDRIARMLREFAGAGADTSRAPISSRGCEPPDESRETVAEPRLFHPGANTPGSNEARNWLGASDLAGHAVEGVVVQKLEEARLLEEAGDLARAEAAFREVLQLAPRQITALCGLGVLARKTGRTDLAIRSFRRALAVVEPVPDYHLHLADALVDAGRGEEAVAEYRRALKLNPSLAAAHVQVGKVLVRGERHVDAAEHFRKALAIDPHNEEALLELGRALVAGCRIDEAIDYFEQAVQLRPESAAAQEALAIAYREDGREEEAEEGFRRAVAFDPLRAASHFHLGCILAPRDPAAAADCFEQVLQLDPEACQAVVQLAILRRQASQFDAAADLLRRAAALQPDDPQRHNFLGVVLLEQGRAAEALECFDEALRLQPDNGRAHVNRGLVLLQAGRLAEGWLEYEWRWRSAESGSAGSNFLSQTVWDGSSLAGRTILVRGEQSLTDEVLFASCYGDLISQAGGILIACDPRLERLMRRSFPDAKISPVVRGREAHWRMPADWRFDVQIPAGSLPLRLRQTRESFPRADRFLAADPKQIEHWQQRFAALGAGLKIGIAWQNSDAPPSLAVSPSGTDASSVSASTLRALHPLLKHPNVHWINVQPARSAAREIAAIRTESGIQIHDWPDAHAPHDLDALAAQIAALDLVISAGGMVAHLAGALGVPSWVLQAPPVDWRWLADGEATPWYASVRLFQLNKLHDSGEVIHRLGGELLKLAQASAEGQLIGSIPQPHWSRSSSPRRIR